MRFVTLLCAFAYAGLAAAEYRSIGENAAILYDAPSTRAAKLFVAGRDLPVEIISTDGSWFKIRDSLGSLAWVERKSLAEKRTLIVTASVAMVRERADEQAPVVFQVQQGVLLDLVEIAGAWAQVRHLDGATGYVRVQQVWGA